MLDSAKSGYSIQSNGSTSVDSDEPYSWYGAGNTGVRQGNHCGREQEILQCGAAVLAIKPIPKQGAAAHAATPELSAINMYLIKYNAYPMVT